MTTENQVSWCRPQVVTIKTPALLAPFDMDLYHRRMRCIPTRWLGKLVLPAVLVLVSPAQAFAQTVEVRSAEIIVDGTAFTLPAPEEKVLSAMGGAPEVHGPAGDHYSNRVFHWLELGIVAFSNPATRQVHAFQFLFDKPGYWKGLAFRGTIVIGRNSIDNETSARVLGSYGFDMDRTEWRCDGLYIHATSYDGERISDVEIGSYEGGTVPLGS